ncbi:hypothetical protein FPOAC1_006438 [Fusarium poae]|uniref:hypothetical protein n=1 Tax=Fusarium poae TaxID=36050 RepID=UPI001CEA2E88|nr:hypothetical protein FPOAC1_006438 [Fusarium poae]KAG8673134.1 hypothetical protein FPOAC1_006438 [Fusarium poae]
MDDYSDRKKKLIVAVDFGETNSSVSYVEVPEGTVPENIPSDWIITITGYPSGFDMGKGDPMRLEVPTQLLYPKGWRFRPLDELWDAPPGSVNTSNVKSESLDFSLRWGYQVSQEMSRVASQSNLDGTLVYRFKTLMDQSDNHLKQKQDLRETLRVLSSNRTCRQEIPVEEMVQLVIIDYLTKLLEFVKARIDDDCNTSTITTTEMVICVPVIWSQKAIRDMQLCMGLAAKLVGFPGLTLKNKSMVNVFKMAESESGATWLLPSLLRSLRPGDTVLILDQGGGTVDAQTFTITSTYPLRLEKEAIRHSGDSCGSNALNEALFKHVLELLDEHEYLEDQPGVTREGIARKMAFHDFENYYKKCWSIFTNESNCNFEVPGIRYDPNFPRDRIPKPNNFTVLATKINSIFHDVFGQIKDIMIEQLETAQKNGIEVNAVVLMGGFSLSDALRRYLNESLKYHGQMYGRTYPPIRNTKHRGTTIIDAVAAGAVLRALDKKGGPRRVTKTAYGLGVYVRYNKELHGNQKPTNGIQNPHEKWIKTIQWVSKLGQEVPPTYEIALPRCCQFSYKDSNGGRTEGFVIRDDIYLSDFASEDHYSIDHERNQGAEFIGSIESDVTHLADTFLDKRSKGPEGQRRGGHKYWEFHYELVYMIDGLNMKSPGIQRLGTEILGDLGVNIASALPSGAA